jgi:hypothetical protein
MITNALLTKESAVQMLKIAWGKISAWVNHNKGWFTSIDM